LAENVSEIVRAARSSHILFLPVIALGEYRFGILASRHRRLYEEWLGIFLPTVTLLDVQAETAVLYAIIGDELCRLGRPIPDNDIWIAALGRQHRLPILSNDTHFDAISGIRRIGW